MTGSKRLGAMSIAILSVLIGGLEFNDYPAHGEIRSAISGALATEFHGPYEQEAPDAAPPVEVIAVGEMRAVMQKGDLSAAFDLRKLSKAKHVYALGPIEGLQGEITVWDSKPTIARISDGKIQISDKSDVKACFLVYSQVESWHEMPIPDEVQTLEQLEAFIPKAAKKQKIDGARPFPFAVKGRFARVSFHVVNKTDSLPHNRELHEKIKVHFTTSDVPGRLVGFYSDRHHGVFTHHGSNVHAHYISDDGTQSGHVESLKVGPGAMLLLP